jgi:hypothetical protein
VHHLVEIAPDLTQFIGIVDVQREPLNGAQELHHPEDEKNTPKHDHRDQEEAPHNKRNHASPF